ncbi:MAG: FAD-dependent oxidoreductase [Chthoniobacterales bacterium]
MFDVAIVGSGPAGAACAAFCARAGVRTLLLEREKFPR